jgi:hypothetical protein
VLACGYGEDEWECEDECVERVDATEERLAMTGFLSFVRNWTCAEANLPMTPSQ